jgi:hypothetical protein
MGLNVYAGAWIRVLIPGEPLLHPRRLVIPCDDSVEAQGVRQMMVKAGAPRSCLVVVEGMLPTRPKSGGTYVQITVDQALEVLADD